MNAINYAQLRTTKSKEKKAKHFGKEKQFSLQTLFAHCCFQLVSLIDLN
jgi:hypothetical protein